MLWTRMMAGTILVATVSACALLGMSPEAKYLGTWEMRDGDAVITLEIMEEGRAVGTVGPGNERLTFTWEIDDKGDIVFEDTEEGDRASGFLKDPSTLVAKGDTEAEAIVFIKVKE